LQIQDCVAEVIRHPIKKAARHFVEHVKFVKVTSRFFDWVPDDFSNTIPNLQWITRYYVLSLCEGEKKQRAHIRHQEIA